MSRVYTLYLPHPIPRAGFSLNRRQPEPSDRSRHPPRSHTRRPSLPPSLAPTPPTTLLPRTNQRLATPSLCLFLSLGTSESLDLFPVSLSRLISLFTCSLPPSPPPRPPPRAPPPIKPSLSPSRALFSRYTRFVWRSVCAAGFLRARVQRFAFSFPQ